MKLVIVGGGASGLTAAVVAARAGADVTIVEHTDKLGKKILSTGNGKCNYTNADIQAKHFHLKEEDLAYFVVKETGYEGILAFFEQLGVEPFVRDGYTYPKSEQASGIRDALLLEAKRLGVTIRYNTRITKIRPLQRGFELEGEISVPSEGNLQPKNMPASQKDKASKNTRNRNTAAKAMRADTVSFRHRFDKIIMATGSNAFSQSGSNGSGLDLLLPFSLKCRTFLPALCPLYAKKSAFFQAANGVRVKAGLSLYINEQKRAYEEGELQITDYGLSGIPIFQLSRHASIALHEGKRVEIKVDVLPEYADKRRYLEERFQKTKLRTAKDFGLGLVNQKLWLAMLERADICENARLVFQSKTGREAQHMDQDKTCVETRNMDQDKACMGTRTMYQSKSGANEIGLETLENALNCLTFPIIGCADADRAQICTGGIDLSEIDFRTLELKKAKGIYVAGEMIDIDGICGGYNLTWAWCSGMFAARKAVQND